MAIEDKSQLPSLSHKPLPPFSPEDEKKAQQELARLRRNKKRGFEGKTLWDWLQLLGVPIFLALATIGFGFVQFYLADQQHVQDQNIALDQQHATTLQAYIDNIQDLLLNHNLRGSKPDDEIATLAQARTLTALEGLGLDSDRKGRLLQFLYEAQLIGFLDGKGNLHPIIISLKDAKFNYATLQYANLRGADLTRADLGNANIRHTDLSGVILVRTDLSGADLTGALGLSQQQLDQVYSCKGATLPKGLICNKNS